MKIRKGFTLVELMIVLVIVGILSGIAYASFGDSTEDAKISATASIIESYNKATKVYNTVEKDYLELKAKIDAISDGDKDMLDEMVQLGVLGKFPKDNFQDPDNLTIEIREMTVNGFRRIIYLYVDTENEYDKHIINQAIGLNKPKDNEVQYFL